MRVRQTVQPVKAAKRWSLAVAAVSVMATGLLTVTSATFAQQSAQPSGVTPGNVQGATPVPQAATQPGAQTGTANQNLSPADAQKAQDAQAAQKANIAASGLFALRGERVAAIQFEGVQFNQGSKLPSELGIKAGDTLDTSKVRAATRRLFLTGRYTDIQLRSLRGPGGVTLIFAGTPRYFVGRIVIQGVRSERLTSILEYATQLQPGFPFGDTDVQAGVAGITQSLAQNGYYEPKVTARTERRIDGHQVDVYYSVAIGAQALVGNVTVNGDPGLTPQQFKDIGRLNTRTTTLKYFKSKNKVTRDTVANSLTRLRGHYQKGQRLEAAIALEKSQYSPERKQLDYSFVDHQGPLVKVVIAGVKISSARQKQLLPIYEESAVDNDLINEGSHNILEFLQRQGYFDADVTGSVRPEHQENQIAPDGTLLPPPSNETQTVFFQAKPGKRYKVAAVNIHGNKYFDTATIQERMQIVKADAFVKYGKFSPVLLSNDKDSITALYRANGFQKVKISATPTKSDGDAKVAKLSIDLTIDEGAQQKFGNVTLTGVSEPRKAEMQGFVTAQTGQPFALASVSGDRDNILGQYLSKGFDQARVEVRQTVRKDDPTMTDVNYMVTEGEEVFVNRLLISGPEHTQPKLIIDQLQLKAGDPLDQSALVEMQRRYYDLAVFSEANVAVQNPAGETDRKNVLVQLNEAKRWDVTYGAGFETQLSTPQTNCRAQASFGNGRTLSNCSAAGTAGASFRVSTDLTRINLFGTDKSLTVHGTYGLLERVATATLNAPRFFGNPNLTAQISGGYSNVQNISTFKASTLQGLFRVTQKVPKADTFIYDFQYRRVSVDQNSLQVTANLIPLLSQPVRVGGPGFTWFHDTRNPTPLDAQKGMYLSVQEFLAHSAFGSQTNFNRFDTTFSTYYGFGPSKHRYTFARNTRFGFINAFSTNPNTGVSGCQGVLLNTNASCDPVPLPERLYAGGATSHRGFGINAAGPRDLTTGYPVGGTAVFVNTLELRLPAPVLPIVGDSLSLVVFHDMGNTFLHIGDIGPSFGRFHQPNENTCRQVTGFVTVGTCDFAYFSHAIGLGARYHTPVGPVRLDLSYNLNPPIYPIIDDFSQATPNHSVGQASHIQFFFSVGQSF